MPDTPKTAADQSEIVVTRTRRVGATWSPWRWRSHPAGADSPQGYDTGSEAFDAARRAMQPPRRLPEPANPDLGRADGTRRPLYVDHRKAEHYSID